MSRSRFSLRVTLLAAVAMVAMEYVGCSAMSSNRVLQSMVITPSNATAQSGEVQFTATGTFSKPPSPSAVPFVDPYSGSWAISNLHVATISQSGLARCVGGASGTVTVTAIASSNSATGIGQMSTA